MSRINSAIIEIGGEYNFATDGGALGTINTGLVIPRNSQVVNFQCVGIVPFTSLGFATVSMGVIQVGVASPAAYPADLVPLTLAFSCGVPVAGKVNTFNTLVSFSPVKYTTDMMVTFTIGNAALTGGRLQFVLGYCPTTF